ncbi:programmed cell death 1 ligand 1-like [Scomber scombrus]|uniref:Programmed cell death 1 ligand 1-like n=1 Tax=Scomber scombrus TaxID=13677 RepID=A0AAV1Q8B8_SCOSC
MNICMDILKLLLLVIMCLRSLCEAVPLPKDGSNRALPTVHVENISPPLGQNVVVHCQAPHNIPVIGVKWIRPDLEKKYVAYWRDGRMDPGNQHPSFKDRTEMQASQINDGDLSVVLMNVSSTDNGRYEAFMKIKTNSIVETKPICVVNLMTAPDASAGDKQTGDKKTGDNVSRIESGYFGFLILFCFVPVFVVFVFRKF